MKQKIMETMFKLKEDYNSGKYTSHEYHNLLTALNNTIWNMERFNLLEGVTAQEMQNWVHIAQDNISV